MAEFKDREQLEAWLRTYPDKFGWLEAVLKFLF